MAEKGQENTETDWDDTPGEPRRVIPICFRQGFLAEKGRENPETDWDDTTGLPRLVIQVRFRVFPALVGLNEAQ